jgi:transcriptional regulator with XRE-family HTH domain
MKARRDEDGRMAGRTDEQKLRELTYLKGLGKRVRLLRQTREMSQDQLATASGMSRNFVSSIERGAHGVDVVRLFHLAVALKVNIERIVAEPDPEKGP